MLPRKEPSRHPALLAGPTLGESSNRVIRKSVISRSVIGEVVMLSSLP